VAQVSLPHADPGRTVGGDPSVCEAVRAARLRRDRDGLVIRAAEPVEPLVGEVGEQDHPAVDGERAAAVLVHLRADVVAVVDDVDGDANASARIRAVRPPSSGRPSVK
jgi:hypothetical protein